MKKRIGTVLMAGVMVCTMGMGIALAGCGGKAKPDFEMPEGGFDTTKNVTITFYHQMGSDLRDILDAYIARFELLYPNIHVEHEPQGDWDTLQDVLTKRIQTGNQPNLAYCYADHVAGYNSARAVQPLDDFLSGGAFKDMKVPTHKVDFESSAEGEPVLDDDGNEVIEDLPLNFTKEQEDMFNPIYFNEGYSIGDGSKMYTLPWAKSTEMMFYNKTFFDQHKDLKVPTTWDEMEEVCEKIKALETDKIKYTPFGYDSEDNWFITMCEQQGSGYTSATGQKFLFDNPENRAFVEKFQGWFKKGYFTTRALSGGKYTSTLFNEQNILMSIGSTGGATYNADTSGTATFERGLAPAPQRDPENPKRISQGPSVCIFKTEDPQEVLASWLFVKYMITNPLYQTEVAMQNGYMPVLSKTVMEQVPAYKNFVAKADGGNNLTALAVKCGMEHEDDYFVSPAFNGSTDARKQVGLLMQAALPGTKSIDKAFKDALQICIAKYGK